MIDNWTPLVTQFSDLWSIGDGLWIQPSVVWDEHGMRIGLKDNGHRKAHICVDNKSVVSKFLQPRCNALQRDHQHLVGGYAGHGTRCHTWPNTGKMSSKEHDMTQIMYLHVPTKAIVRRSYI